MSAAPLLHVGYVKTGSTWLQRHVTDNPRLGLAEAFERGAIRELLIHPNELWYDADAAREHFAPRAAGAREQGRVPVITHERLSGNPVSGGFDAAIVARRLHALAPDARVLLVIREQRDHLRSIYAEYVTGGGPLALEAFVEPPEGSQIPLFDRRFLEFDRLIALYGSLFGGQRVLVLPFELLRRDRVAFCNRILAFVERETVSEVPEDVVRPSVGAVGMALRRRMNRFAQRNRLNPGGLLHLEGLPRAIRGVDRLVPRALQQAGKRRLRERIDALVGVTYAASNRRTAELTGLDLAAWGYPLE